MKSPMNCQGYRGGEGEIEGERGGGKVRCNRLTFAGEAACIHTGQSSPILQLLLQLPEL